MEHRVGLFRCNQYSPEVILPVLKKALAAIAFDVSSVKGKRVLLKPNMLGAYFPEMGITTHPAFVEAAIILFKELGGEVWLGDSANGIFPIDCVWERTGMREVCRRHDVAQKIFEREGSVVHEGLLISKPVLEADVLVNLPKFKTHGLTVLTVATKNLYGCIPGLQKTKYHKNNIDRLKFAKLLARLSQIAKPSLNLVDGIVGMDGNGPSAGRCLKMDLIVAGTNCHAVDATCARLVGLDPLDVDTLWAAQYLGIWNHKEKINTVGEKLDSCRIPDFILPKTFTKGMRDWWISKLVIDRIWGGIHIKPRIDPKKCQRCYLCVEACPVKAISAPADYRVHLPVDNSGTANPSAKKRQPPRVINSRCVECYCCHEVCPYKAIDLNESWGVKIGRFLGERRIKKMNSE